jgi:hypothetical protein
LSKIGQEFVEKIKNRSKTGKKWAKIDQKLIKNTSKIRQHFVRNCTRNSKSIVEFFCYNFAKNWSNIAQTLKKNEPKIGQKL